MRTVEVVPHNPRWQAAFESEAVRIAKVLGDNTVAIHHIGSTAIAGIDAKPILDLLIEVRDLRRVDAQQHAMVSLGYEAMGEFGIVGRQFFRKDNLQQIRTHHVHAFEVGSAQIERHLLFRDYMRVHPKVAKQYGKLKRRLAKLYPTDIEAYCAGKDDFIKRVDENAAFWKKDSTL